MTAIAFYSATAFLVLAALCVALLLIVRHPRVRWAEIAAAIVVAAVVCAILSFLISLARGI